MSQIKKLKKDDRQQSRLGREEVQGIMPILMNFCIYPLDTHDHSPAFFLLKHPNETIYTLDTIHKKMTQALNGRLRSYLRTGKVENLII